jgi:hypothetical protein
MKKNVSRRGFLTAASSLAASAAVTGFVPVKVKAESDESSGNRSIAETTNPTQNREEFASEKYTLDLTPAKWIWYPAKRILPNSFFHFRKTFEAKGAIRSARGWVVGDSRYVLYCNGRRIQFGPAPADPRYTEADPVDLTSFLLNGSNVIGATVLYYGFGDGTWPAGKAGLIFKLAIEYENGSSASILSDASWNVQAAKSWQPGKYKRWYLRALQESFDNRVYPAGWTEPRFKEDPSWKKASVTGEDATKTALATAISDYLYDSGSPAVSQLRKRNIPLIKEEKVQVERLAESHWVRWTIPAEEYFDLVTADAYEAMDGPPAEMKGEGQWAGNLQGFDKGLVLTFELKEQVVGWPYFSMDAPEGTVVELMVQQGHVPFSKGGPALINNNLNSWTRFICKEGRNDFITFDYESAKWLQLHIRGAARKCCGSSAGGVATRLSFSQSTAALHLRCGFAKIVYRFVQYHSDNSQETIVDCMGRERQQYSGDIGHVVHMLHRVYGEQQLPARFVSTFSQGLTLDGFFMDSWPAYDRLNRLAQRQLGLTPWGPLLDHGVGFTHDSWYHYLYTGRKEDLEEVFPRLVRFTNTSGPYGSPGALLPVENLGVPTVWMDTDSYKMQRHKQCAFNLYVAGMLQDAFAPLCFAFNRADLQKEAQLMCHQLVKAVRKTFWSEKEKMLIVNLPWLKEEGGQRTCERSISQAILSGFVTEEEKKKLVDEMINLPPRFGLCYPPNAQWRYWALAACGVIQPVLNELVKKWIAMPAVQQNNTMPETWQQAPDTHAQYSHASLAPIYVAYMSIAGISLLEPGGRKLKIRPQPGDIDDFSIANHTPHGAVKIKWAGNRQSKTMSVSLPSGISAELWLDERENIQMTPLRKVAGMAVYALKGGETWQRILRFT